MAVPLALCGWYATVVGSSWDLLITHNIQNDCGPLSNNRGPRIGIGHVPGLPQARKDCEKGSNTILEPEKSLVTF